MNPLPQRKKTAEEIARLREEFMPPTPAPSAAAKTEEAAPAPLPDPVSYEPRPPVEAKPVRSLRKSERIPLPEKAAAPIVPVNPQSALPSHRRSDQELNQIRRSQAFEVQAPAKHLIALTAHPILLGLGYSAAFIAAFLPIVNWLWTDVSYPAPAGFCVLALLTAAFIALKKRRSIHHAAFIGLIALFTIVFGALYYFPQLRNGP
jgi:hypothetical protein